MKNYSALDHVNYKWYNNPYLPLIPFIRKIDGNTYKCYNCKTMIIWLVFRVYFDKYPWGINKAFLSKLSFDTPVFRITLL